MSPIPETALNWRVSLSVTRFFTDPTSRTAISSTPRRLPLLKDRQQKSELIHGPLIVFIPTFSLFVRLTAAAAPDFPPAPRFTARTTSSSPSSSSTMKPSRTWNYKLLPFIDLIGLADPHHPPASRALRNAAATWAAFETTPSLTISSSHRMINYQEAEGPYSKESEGEDTEEPAETVRLEIAAHDRRVLLLDLVCGLLEHICRAQGRWVRFVPEEIPVDRLNRSSPEAWALWKVIAEDPVVPHAREDAVAHQMAGHLGIRLMASMWEDLVRDLFAGLCAPVAGEDRQAPAVDRRPTGVEEYAWLFEKLVRRYGIFEALPTDPASHKAYVLQLGKLAEAALELRDALVGQNACAEDEAAVVEIFGPDSLPVTAACRTTARLEAAAGGDGGDGKGPSVLRVLTLCGGLRRRSRTPIEGGTGSPFCERRPVVATVRARVAGLPMIQK